MQRKPQAPHENHERWLVSYADFITLLFAFFVVMFASTQADKSKARAVSESVKDALEHGQFSNTLSTVLGRGKHENSRPAANPERAKVSDNLPPQKGPLPPPADLAKSLATLQRGLGSQVKAGEIGLKLEGRGLVVSLREATFFASGDDTISPGSEPILAKIAAEVQDFGNPIRLEGHTDSQPIHNSRFRSNWELSVARSIAMLELLERKFGIAPERLSVAGYAENAPVESNDTEEGRARNRRVDLVILSDDAMRSEPAR
ncbi:MAG TPA: flagellar motor protein MotB [Bryobacteraceae bacterium]|nr:flagellar motor protein MotB [Bryobacteraceae bacterium]